MTTSDKTWSSKQQSSRILTILQQKLLLRISKVVRGIVVIVSQCIFSIMYYHFPNFVIIYGVSPFANYHSINEIRPFTQFVVFLILFSFQRLQLLLIIIFKAKRLNNKIDFSKKKDVYNLLLLWELWWSNYNKNGDPRNGQTQVVLRSFCSPQEGLLGLFSP